MQICPNRMWLLVLRDGRVYELWGYSLKGDSAYVTVGLASPIPGDKLCKCSCFGVSHALTSALEVTPIHSLGVPSG